MHANVIVTINSFIHEHILTWVRFLLVRASSDYAQPITGQVTEVTCPVIGRAQLGLSPSKRQKRALSGLFPFCRIGTVREIDRFATYLSLITEMGVVFHDVNVRHQATHELNLFAVSLFKKYKDIFDFFNHFSSVRLQVPKSFPLWWPVYPA